MPKTEEGALDEFSKDFSQEKTIDDFSDQETPMQETAEDVEGEEKGTERKNRHTRRLETKLQQERESNIHLAAKLEALSESQKFSRDVAGLEPDEALLTLYGNDENGKRAAQITQRLLNDTAQKAKAMALEEIRSAQAAEAAEVRESEEFIDDQLESLEDESGIDLTSNSPLGRKNRTEFLSMVERLSPKDEEGNIKEYADFGEVFETFQERKAKPTSRQKDLASRGMIRSGSTTEALKDTAGESYLKNLGII